MEAAGSDDEEQSEPEAQEERNNLGLVPQAKEPSRLKRQSQGRTRSKIEEFDPKGTQ